MFQEKPYPKWEVPYIVTSGQGKTLALYTGARLINSSSDKIKRCFTSQRASANTPVNSTFHQSPEDPDAGTDASVTQSLERLLSFLGNTEDTSKSTAKKFLVQLVGPTDEQA